jgi:UTP--glucose-1-phosphate uridylyltransferase
MQQDGANQPAIASFILHFERTAGGAREFLIEDDIEPVVELPDSTQFAAYRESGSRAVHRTVVIKLNGGLGTGMGLEKAKSLLEVRDGLTFLDLIARQILATRADTGAAIPLLLMNSSRTAAESVDVLSTYPELPHTDLPSGFIQNRVPKLRASDLSPAKQPDQEDLGWCPPGHGDLYTALAGSGLLATLLGHGFDYAFVSNADNLGAVLDPGILGFMVENNHDFLMEAADRSAADRKGGHLCRLPDGRLALRESAQCRPGDEAAFQDVGRHRFFNTNNLWLHLPSLAVALDENGGYLPLDTIVNHKRLDPRDPDSPPVLQLETAMGAAVSLFERAAAVRVPRRRFSPVKNTDDLLAVRSDAYRLTDDWLVVLHPDRTAPPVIDLDPAYFKMIDDFEQRFPAGPPSLQCCESLTVEGDITFGANVTVEGKTTFRADRPACVPHGSVHSGEIRL